MTRARILASTLAAGLVIAAAVLTGCGASDRRFGPVQRSPAPVVRLASGRPVHVAVLLMENEEFGDVVGSPDTPFINALARRYALADRAFAITHPSLPNYLALTGGSTFGIDSDCTSCSVPGAGLAGQLTRAGITWRAYMEDLPRPCFTGADSGEYAKKHDPFVYYRSIAGSRAACDHVVALTQLATDARSDRLPAIIWITPNLCHDMHDCAPSVGDRFLAGLVPGLLRDLGKRGLLILTWDEGSSDQGCCRLASGGHVATIVAGGGARSGARLKVPVDHYSILQTIEDLFGLPRLGGAACACTPSLAPLLRTPPRIRKSSGHRSARHRSARPRSRAERGQS